MMELHLKFLLLFGGMQKNIIYRKNSFKEKKKISKCLKKISFFQKNN